jgi:hypothetical protein
VVDEGMANDAKANLDNHGERSVVWHSVLVRKIMEQCVLVSLWQKRDYGPV